jgi:sucrose-phosphate synthase
MGKAKNEGLYIALLSVHGLIRGNELELGRDPDTGGQILYVVELARALAKHPSVDRVDLFTRQVIDKKVDESYAQREEKLAENAYIIRIPFGPRRYLRKEKLWPHLPSFVDNALPHFRKLRRIPDIVHGHYADAGMIGATMAHLLGVPFVFTGHSLGRVKMERMLESGARRDQINQRYNMDARIEAEELALDAAPLVITSTHQEIEQQYEMYEHYEPSCMRVIPPGVNLDRFSPPVGKDAPYPIRGEIERFLRDPGKPMVLAMARPDERKNISTLIHAYANNAGLREAANLVLVLGNRDDVRAMDRGSRKVMIEVLYLIDKYDLYGSIALPKHHAADDVPDIYRLAAASRGVFVNPAWTEPFGLTLIEAAASGLPIAATNDGGPRDIIGACENGILIDPFDAEKMGATLLDMLQGKQWDQWSEQGMKGATETFSWSSHVKRYLKEVNRLLQHSSSTSTPKLPARRSRIPEVDRILITDVDNTLTGDDEAVKKLLQALDQAGTFTGFGIATGRAKASASAMLEEIGAPPPDILITSNGASIRYGRDLTEDTAWKRHIDYRWEPDAIRAVMADIPGVYLQKESEQHRFKISYTIDKEEAPSVRRIQRLLREAGLRVNLTCSFAMYLDLMPIRASCGLAIRYLAFKWGIPFEHLLVAGDSGNDEDMLGGETLGVVVGNHSPELNKLRGRPRIYFAEGCHANGILEGIAYYDFFGEITVPEERHDDS